MIYIPIKEQLDVIDTIKRKLCHQPGINSFCKTRKLAMRQDRIRDNKAIVHLLNDLVRVNYDRVYGYEKVALMLHQVSQDFKIAVHQSMDISRGFITYWQQIIRSMGFEPLSTSVLNSKSDGLGLPELNYLGNNASNTVRMCIEKEQRVLDTYDEVLASSSCLPENIINEITRQKQKIQQFLKLLKTHSFIVKEAE